MGTKAASPASNGGRGLKPGHALDQVVGDGASPASKGGRGVKKSPPQENAPPRGIARQQWRARIETIKQRRERHAARAYRETADLAPPASNGRRGLQQ